MKLVIVGSRTFNDYELLKKETDKLISEYNITEIVSGGANSFLNDIFCQITSL